MNDGYISVEDAAKELGVNRSTMHYYKKQFEVEYKKFPLDKRKYITLTDLERIKEAKKAAAEGKH
jgi:transposase-like protein